MEPGASQTRSAAHTAVLDTPGRRLTRTRKEGEGRLKNYCQISGLDIG